MSKSPDAFRTISEVADWLGVQAHVLRFWESKFTQVKPVKRAGGRRYYRPADMLLLGGIKKLLHDDGLTIKGVQKALREQGVAHVSDLSQSLDETSPAIDITPAEHRPKVVRFKDVGAPQQVELTAQPRPPAEQTDQPQFDLEPDQMDDPDPVIELETAAAEALDALDPESYADETMPQFSRRHRGVEPMEPAAETAAETAMDPTPAPQPDEPDEEPSIEVADTVEDIGDDIVEAPVETLADSIEEPVVDPVVETAPAILPDPPPADTLPYTPGPLARLVHIDTLSPDLAREIVPLARELRQWHDRAMNMGMG